MGDVEEYFEGLPDSLEEVQKKGLQNLRNALNAYNLAANSTYGAASFMVVSSQVAEELNRLREELNN
jgi:hypothetical protein